MKNIICWSVLFISASTTIAQPPLKESFAFKSFKKGTVASYTCQNKKNAFTNVQIKVVDTHEERKVESILHNGKFKDTLVIHSLSTLQTLFDSIEVRTTTKTAWEYVTSCFTTKTTPEYTAQATLLGNMKLNIDHFTEGDQYSFSCKEVRTLNQPDGKASTRKLTWETTLNVQPHQELDWEKGKVKVFPIVEVRKSPAVPNFQETTTSFYSPALGWIVKMTIENKIEGDSNCRLISITEN